MGNSQSSTNDIESCLLSKREFVNLRAGDKFDHRDKFGMFVEAIVLQKSGNNVYIHYEDFGEEWDTSANYKNNPLSFAKYKSVSITQSSSSLSNSNVGDFILFRPNPNDTNCKWKKGKIMQKDTRSGQVKIAYKNSKNMTKKRWTHLDNILEVSSFTHNTQQSHTSATYQSQQQSQQQQHQHNTGNNNNNYNTNGYNQYQMQEKCQIQRQDQMTVRTQLLLDDTHKQIKLTRNYLEAAAKNVSKNELSVYNQKVVVGLTCFRMKVNGMRNNGKKEGLDFKNAFKSSAMIIKQFENEFKLQFGDNKYLMQRLQPCLNYMRAVLKGSKSIPSLPYINDYEFNENVASSVISSVTHAQNHVIPDRMKEINNNNKQYKKYQNQLKQQYQDEQQDTNDQIKDIDFNELIQDYNSKNIAFGKSKQEQDAIIEEQQNKYKFGAPDLMDMDQ